MIKLRTLTIIVTFLSSATPALANADPEACKEWRGRSIAVDKEISQINSKLKKYLPKKGSSPTTLAEWKSTVSNEVFNKIRGSVTKRGRLMQDEARLRDLIIKGKCYF